MARFTIKKGTSALKAKKKKTPFNNDETVVISINDVHVRNSAKRPAPELLSSLNIENWRFCFDSKMKIERRVPRGPTRFTFLFLAVSHITVGALNT